MATITHYHELQNLSDRLSGIAAEWRAADIARDHKRAHAAVLRFHTIANELYALGWRGEGLGLDDELPDELLPTWLVF
jgi:hypothetical protein